MYWLPLKDQQAEVPDLISTLALHLYLSNDTVSDISVH